MHSKILKKSLKKAGILLFWILLWQLVAMALNQPMILTGPIQVLGALFSLIFEAEFWLSIGLTLGKIAAGFVLALVVGVGLGILSGRWQLVCDFLEPVMHLTKAIPVASFVILALLWAGSSMLSVLISFLVALPIIYVHTLAGLKSTDQKLLEMARVFDMPWQCKIRYIYWEALKPHLAEGFRITLGFCWKSGVAAEVIGVPDHSIGEKLYMAKIYLSTDQLLAWTVVVITLSTLFEKICLKLIGGKAGETDDPGAEEELQR